MLGRRSEAGDTIIEVIMAVIVFSMVIVTALSIMNYGTATSRRSLEMSLVRQQMDNQAEILRFIHDAYLKDYEPGMSANSGLSVSGPAGEFYALVNRVKATGARSASTFSGNAACTTPPGGSFVLNTHTAALETNSGLLKPAKTYAQLVYGAGGNTVSASEGLWVEAIRSNPSVDPAQANSGYIDFHIRACWYAPGSSVASNMGTIVRLYEPRG